MLGDYENDGQHLLKKKKLMKKILIVTYIIHILGKLKKREVAKEYKRQISEKWEEWKGLETESVGMEWDKMKAAVKEVAEGVCGMKRLGRGKKGTDWWDDELERLCKEKKK